jgi:hypothetical protein
MARQAAPESLVCSDPIAMPRPLRDAWAARIRAEDYEAHMSAVGQAQANAALVADWFHAWPPQADAAVLFVGAGTGQMFEYVSPALLLPYRTTFSDLNGAYLERLNNRLSSVAGLRHATLVDDVESTRLTGRFALVVAVLLLEHVEWRTAVATMCSLSIGRVLTVIQENPPAERTALTQSRSIPGTMNLFRELHPALVPCAELEREIRRWSFAKIHAARRGVADGKKMAALGFERLPESILET